MAQSVTDDPDGSSWSASSSFEGGSSQPVERPLFRRLPSAQVPSNVKCTSGRVARRDADRLTEVVDLQYRIEAE